MIESSRWTFNAKALPVVLELVETSHALLPHLDAGFVVVDIDAAHMEPALIALGNFHAAAIALQEFIEAARA